MMRFLFIAFCALAPLQGLANEISCHFKKYCETGKRCERTSYRYLFVQHDDGRLYSMIDQELAGLTASGVDVSFDGKSGSIAMKSASALDPYADFWVLSLHKGQAVLTATGFDADEAYSFTYLGTCK